MIVTLKVFHGFCASCNMQHRSFSDWVWGLVLADKERTSTEKEDGLKRRMARRRRAKFKRHGASWRTETQVPKQKGSSSKELCVWVRSLWCSEGVVHQVVLCNQQGSVWNVIRRAIRIVFFFYHQHFVLFLAGRIRNVKVERQTHRVRKTIHG